MSVKIDLSTMSWIITLIIVILIKFKETISTPSCLWHFPDKIWNCGNGIQDQVLLQPGDIIASLSKSLQCYIICPSSSNLSVLRIEALEALPMKQKVLKVREADLQSWISFGKEKSTYSFDIILLTNVSSPSLTCTWYKQRYRSNFIQMSTSRGGQTKTLGKRLKPVIRLTVAYLKPFAYYAQSDLIGIDIDIWKTIAKVLRIKLNFIFLGGDMGGTRRLVREGKADASGMSLIISRWLEGLHVIPNMQGRDLVFLVKHPEPKTSYTKLTGPFDLMTWILLLATLIGVCLFLAFSPSMNPLLTKVQSPLEKYLVGFGIMIGQSLPQKSIFPSLKTKPTSISIIFWLLASYLIILAYKSDLLASLCRQELEDPIDTYQDLLDRKIKAYVPSGTMTGHLIKTSPNPFVRDFYHKAVSEVKFVKGKYSEEVLEEVYSGKAAINVIYETSLETPGRVAKNILVGGNLQCGYYHRKHDFTMEKAKGILDKLVDAGIKDKIVNRYLWKMSEKERYRLRHEEPVNRSEPLTISHFLPLFILYSILIGVVSAIAFTWDSAISDALTFVT